jgi:hypothetical protein
MSNHERFIGVLLDGGKFDKCMRDEMIYIIERTAERLRDANNLTRVSLGRELGMDRNRVARITKALGITSLFD